MRGLLVQVQKQSIYPGFDCSKNGVSHQYCHWGLLLVGDRVPKIDQPNRWTPAVVLITNQLWGKSCCYCEPKELPRHCRSVIWTFGGNKATSENEWFKELLGDSLPIHDRAEITH